MVAVPNVESLCTMGTTVNRAKNSNLLSYPARASPATGLTTRGHGLFDYDFYFDPRIRRFVCEHPGDLVDLVIKKQGAFHQDGQAPGSVVGRDHERLPALPKGGARTRSYEP